MTAIIPIIPSQWVLAWEDHCFDDDRSVVENIERLNQRGAGWDMLSADIFVIREVEHVMPQTYRTTGGRRERRACVIAAAPTHGEMLALRDRLFAIGVETDNAIEREAYRLVAEFERKTRADALAQVHAALPHIFGRSA